MSLNSACLRVSLAALACLLASCGGGDESRDPPPLPAPVAPAAGTLGDTRLPQLLEWARASQGLPAMGAMIIRNGQISERAVVGVRSAGGNVLATTADNWHMGSNTKSMTATLAALLIEDGIISWDTTPAQVWPGSLADMHANFRNITLRQFLSHTSGMQRDDEFAGSADSAGGTVMEKRRAWALHALSEAPTQPAGTASYSNTGFIVAAAMLETLTGSQWETLLSTRVFAPLGMTHSGFGAPGTEGLIDQPLGHTSLAAGFEPVPVNSPQQLSRAIGPAGTVNTTMDDFALYLMAHIAGELGTPGLLSVNSFRTLHAPVTGVYALGWGFTQSLGSLGVSTYGHSGSDGHWYALMWFAPARDLGVLIVTNGGGDRSQAAVVALDQLLQDRIAATP